MKRKEIVGVLLFVIVMVGLFQYGVKRIEKIENGNMVLVNQNQMDR